MNLHRGPTGMFPGEAKAMTTHICLANAEGPAGSGRNLARKVKRRGMIGAGQRHLQAVGNPSALYDRFVIITSANFLRSRA